MSLKGTNCHFNGASSELYVAYKATEKGFVVNYPLFTQSRYDLIIDTGKKLLKVQVKRSVKSSVKGNYFIQIRLGGCGHPDYKEGDYDYVAMVFDDKVWMLPYKDTEGHNFEIFAEKINGYD